MYSFIFLQGMYVFLHAVKGTPFETPDQGKARLLTHWEQLDYGVQFTSSRKFFTISPIILWVPNYIMNEVSHKSMASKASIKRVAVYFFLSFFFACIYIKDVGSTYLQPA